MADLSGVFAAYQRYVEARSALLAELHLNWRSNRDPLCEFSEWLVAALVEGKRADSPVQSGWDVQTPDGERIQVKYLANPSEAWINEHGIQVNEQMDSYAVVFFEAFQPKGVIIFPARKLAAIGTALGKRHANLDRTLWLTRANYRQVLNNVEWFKTLGVRLYTPPEWVLR